MGEPRAVDADALDLTARLARLVRRVVETVFERRGTAVDDENFLRPLPFELETIRILALAECGGRFRRISQDHLHPFRDRPRNPLHRARLGHDDRLEQRHRNQQHLAARLGDEVREHRIPGHQRHLAERVASFQLSQELPRAAIAEHRGSHRAAQHDTEMRGFLAPVGNRFIGFERNDARAIDQLLQAFGGEVLEESYLFLEKCLWVHGLDWVVVDWQDEPIVGSAGYWTKVLLVAEHRSSTMMCDAAFKL